MLLGGKALQELHASGLVDEVGPLDGAMSVHPVHVCTRVHPLMCMARAWRVHAQVDQLDDAAADDDDDDGTGNGPRRTIDMGAVLEHEVRAAGITPKKGYEDLVYEATRMLMGEGVVVKHSPAVQVAIQPASNMYPVHVYTCASSCAWHVYGMCRSQSSRPSGSGAWPSARGARGSSSCSSCPAWTSSRYVHGMLEHAPRAGAHARASS